MGPPAGAGIASLAGAHVAVPLGAAQAVLVPVGTLCHQLATWSTSASNLQGRALVPVKPGPLHELGAESEGQRPPSAYIGKTPIEIVVRFKDPATFPWHKLPEAVCGRPFEELWWLARHSG